MTSKKKSQTQQIMNFTFNFRPGTSFFHKLHPVNKILWFFLTSFVLIIQTSIITIVIIMVITFIIAKTNSIKFSELTFSLRWIIIFILISAFTIFVRFLGLDLLIFLKALYLSIRYFILVLTLSSSGFILLNTTHPKDIVYGLRKLGLPYMIAFSFVVGLRYIPIIQTNTKMVIIAQKARGLDRANTKSLKQAIELIKDRLTTSLILIFRNVESTGHAMQLRAFGRYKNRTDLYQIKYSRFDFIFLTLLVVIVSLLTLYPFNLVPFLPPLPPF